MRRPTSRFLLENATELSYAVTCMTNQCLKGLVIGLLKIYGRTNVMRQLVIAGIGPSTASLLVRGKYDCEPRLLLSDAVLRAADALKGAA